MCRRERKPHLRDYNNTRYIYRYLLLVCVCMQVRIGVDGGRTKSLSRRRRRRAASRRRRTTRRRRVYRYSLEKKIAPRNNQ